MLSDDSANEKTSLTTNVNSNQFPELVGQEKLEEIGKATLNN